VREGDFFRGIVDNPLYETRLHELSQGDEIVFHQNHILAVHGIHRLELLSGMNAIDLKELAQWLGSQSD
jgi:uridine kinase